MYKILVLALDDVMDSTLALTLDTIATANRLAELKNSRTVVDWLETVGRRCPLIGASCWAVFLLAEAGLLANKTATTTWWLGSVFRDRYPDVELDETRMVVEAEGILCAGAALAQIDLMLHLIARAASPDLSREMWLAFLRSSRGPLRRAT